VDCTDSIALACLGPFMRDNGKRMSKRMCSHWSASQTLYLSGCFLFKLIHYLTWVTSLTITETTPDRFASIHTSCHSTELDDVLSRWKIPASGRTNLLGIKHKRLALMKRVSGRRNRISWRQTPRMHPSSAATLNIQTHKMDL